MKRLASPRAQHRAIGWALFLACLVAFALGAFGTMAAHAVSL